MTGKAYYITTLADWQRHAARFANSHFIVLDSRPADDLVIPNPAAVSADGGEGSAVALRDENQKQIRDVAQVFRPEGSIDKNAAKGLGSEDPSYIAFSSAEPPHSTNDATRTCPGAVDDSQRILVLIEADEGVHLSLEDEPAFEPLPHPLAQKPISDAAQAALARHGVAPGATTFDAAEALARIHPLLRHRVF
jgi:hypothetical protein